MIFVVLPAFSLWLFRNLILYSPNFIHATDLHTVLIATLYRKFYPRTFVVYDMFDVLSTYWRTNTIIYSIVRSLERKAFVWSNAVVSTSIERLSLFSSLRQRNKIVVPNYPKLVSLRARRKLNKNRMLIRYAGGIGEPSLIPNVVKACHANANLDLELAGRLVGNSVKLRSEIAGNNTSYRGILSPDEALIFIGEADVVPVLYDQNLSYLVSPQKLFDAMMLGVPVVTNVCQSLVLREQCGLFVGEPTPPNLQAAFEYLLNNPAARAKMGENGRSAAERSYNWDPAVARLKSLYKRLQEESGQQFGAAA